MNEWVDSWMNDLMRLAMMALHCDLSVMNRS